MIYYPNDLGGKPPGCGLGWLQILASGVNAVWNVFDSTNKAEAQKWANSVVSRTAAYESGAGAAQAAEDAAAKAARDEKMFKVLKVGGLVAAAAVVGTMLAKGK